MATHPKTAKEETPIIDQFRDRFIDLREKTLNFLETQVRAGHMDRMEATQKFAAVLLMDYAKMEAYIKAMTKDPQLWGYAVIGGPVLAKKSGLSTGLGRGH